MLEIEDRRAHSKYSPAETDWPNVVLTGRGDERGIFLGPISLRQTMLTFLLFISNPSLKPQPNTSAGENEDLTSLAVPATNSSLGS